MEIAADDCKYHQGKGCGIEPEFARPQSRDKRAAVSLELTNVANLPITLWPGMKIGQLCILRLTSPAEYPYGSSRAGSKYQGQRGPTPSRSYLNFIRSTQVG